MVVKVISGSSDSRELVHLIKTLQSTRRWSTNEKLEGPDLVDHIDLKSLQK